jgi:4-diphosphocytidyl-2-C-methyl-D-erythritol kinase
MLTIPAPAKINLTLEVLGIRPDGYHEIKSIIQTVDFYDELFFEISQNTTYHSNLPGWDSGQSLIARTVDLIRQITGTTENATITVNKRVPLASGLGGDSSDAAAALKGLNSLWNLGLSTIRLHSLASQLGSDVPFFINGGIALMEGRGEVLTVLPRLTNTWLILIIPDISLPPHKTETMYGRLKPEYYTDGSITAHLADAIRKHSEIDPALLFNTFENVAFEKSERLYDYRQHLLKTGATNLHLAGSGPAMFTLVPDEAAGKDLCARFETQGLRTYLTHTLNYNNPGV